jgi:hypothetical protein
MFQKAYSQCILFVCLLLLSAVNSYAQNLSLSPYSVVGIGDMQFTGTLRQAAMGQTGFAVNDTFEINNLNPASYSSLKYTVFEGAYTYTMGRIGNNLSNANINNSTFSYFMLGMPLWQKIGWGFAAGLQPYSGMGYNVRLRSSYNNVPILTDMNGRGGLSRMYIGTGVRLYKGLSAGVNVGYIFGQTQQNNTLIADPISNLFSISNERNTTVADFKTDLGLQYRFALGQNYRLGLGLIYHMPSSLNASQDFVFRTTTPDGRFTIDTIEKALNMAGTISMPAVFGGGITIKKLEERTGLDYWQWAFDVKQGQWQNFRFFDRVDSLVSNLQINSGFSIVPKPSNVRNMFARAEYRFGVRYDAGNIRLSGNTISTVAFSAGIGMPLGKSRSRLNITGEYIRRGTTLNNLLFEEYVRVSLGITLLDRWFVRYRYD